MKAPLQTLVHLERADGVATISINRPDALNSVNPAVLHQLDYALKAAAADQSVRGIILSGRGKAFIVGADLRFLLRCLEAGDMARIVQFTEAGHRLLNTIDDCPKPVVAQVHGVALGAGTEFALACDCVVASSAANFGLPETGLGIYPCFGGTQRTPRAVGTGLAKWLIYTGKTLSAKEAWQVGLVDLLTPPGELDRTARGVALGEIARPQRPAPPPEHAEIARFFIANRVDSLRTGTADTGGNGALSRAMRLVADKAPLALRLAERLIDEGSRLGLPAALQLEIDHVTEIYRSEDAYRGLASRATRQVGRPGFLGK